MFPYRPRKPAYGGSKKHCNKSNGTSDVSILKPSNKPSRSVPTDAQASGRRRCCGKEARDGCDGITRDPTTSDTSPISKGPLEMGGNLQRSILLDLAQLRKRYFSSFIQATTAEPKTSSSHSTLGSSFRQFKTCFSEARFGAIHTRAVPPRVDRGEYLQLLYSSCFYLLEESIGKFHGGKKLFWDRSNSWSKNEMEDVRTIADAGYTKSNIFHGIFAVYALYTLYETNALPETHLARNHTKRTNSGHLQEESLKEAWSMLSVGLANEDSKLYRRSFVSPIRIDRWNYLLLLQLRDICKSRVSQCHAEETEIPDTDCAWKCNCGPAHDAAHIIGRMLFDDSYFEYCEYHGPCSLEGLAGYPNFYRAYFCKNSTFKSREKYSKTKLNACERLLTSKSIPKGQLDDFVKGCHSDSLDLPSLQDAIENYHFNLQSAMSHIQHSGIPGGDLQPRQREIVLNCMRGMLNPTLEYVEAAGLLNTIVSPAKNDRAEVHISLNNRFEDPVSGNFQDLPPLLLPNYLLSIFGGNIRDALSDFQQHVDMIRNSILKEKMKATTRDTNLNLRSDLSYLSPIIGEETSATKGLKHPYDAFFEVESDISVAEFEKSSRNSVVDDISFATGAGKKALLSLLSVADGNVPTLQGNDNQQSDTLGAPQTSTRTASNMDHEKDNEYLDGNESISSEEWNSQVQSQPSLHGSGKRALDILLSCALNGSDEMSYTSFVNYGSSIGQHGSGQRALDLLLSEALNVPPSTQGKRGRRGKTTIISRKRAHTIAATATENATKPAEVSTKKKKVFKNNHIAKEDNQYEETSLGEDSTEFELMASDEGEKALKTLFASVENFTAL